MCHTCLSDRNFFLDTTVMTYENRNKLYLSEFHDAAIEGFSMVHRRPHILSFKMQVHLQKHCADNTMASSKSLINHYNTIRHNRCFLSLTNAINRFRDNCIFGTVSNEVHAPATYNTATSRLPQ